MSDDTTRDDLETELEQTREHLAETVDALTDKLDVKSRARGKVADVKVATQQKAQDEDARRAATLLAAGVVGVVGFLLWYRNR